MNPESSIEVFSSLLKPEVISVVVSTILAGLISYLVARQKNKVDHMSFEKSFEHEKEKFRKEAQNQAYLQKLEVAHRFAELSVSDTDVAAIFLNNVAKETAVAFLYLDDNLTKSKIWVRDEANLLVGRSEGCDIQFSDDIYVSREHCVLHTASKDTFLIPLVPTNPIRLNEAEIEGKTKLTSGDRFSIATHEFVYFKL